ncbi:Rv0361 family membrane protein [Brevibacillus formosus]|uniref:Rv0361 family membrane protein n=1 Tax=Brevibacillus formosus TaxID=54913 RepID=UPI003F1C651A
MTKGQKIALCLSLGAVLSTGGFMASKSFASASQEKEITETVHKYLDAVENRNVAVMAELTKDLRFENDKEKKKVYKSFAKHVTDVDQDSVSVEIVDDEKANVSFKYSNKHASEEITLPVVKENGEWKILVENNRPKKGPAEVPVKE